jgi:hypothetical protein
MCISIVCNLRLQCLLCQRSPWACQCSLTRSAAARQCFWLCSSAVRTCWSTGVIRSTLHGHTGMCVAEDIIANAMQVQGIASGAGTVIGTCIRIPCEVLKQRLQVWLWLERCAPVCGRGPRVVSPAPKYTARRLCSGNCTAVALHSASSLFPPRSMSSGEQAIYSSAIAPWRRWGGTPMWWRRGGRRRRRAAAACSGAPPRCSAAKCPSTCSVSGVRVQSPGSPTAAPEAHLNCSPLGCDRHSACYIAPLPDPGKPARAGMVGYQQLKKVANGACFTLTASSLPAVQR